MRLRRGDIVWARVVFPKKWWPGLVRSIDGHRVAVSFFNDGEDPRVFLETEVFSFAENFELLTKTLKNCSRGKELLDSALKLVARRAAYSLKCPCHFRPSPEGGKIYKRSRSRRDAFRPDDLLSLVHGLAVSPFVGDSDFVSTVTMASQLNVFRCYLIAERKGFLDLKATKERLSNSPLPTTGAQSSGVSKLGFESLNADQPNSGSWIEVNHANTQSLNRMLVNVQYLAFDNNYTREGCLSTLQRNCMPIRNLGCQAVSNFEINKCSESSSDLQLCQPSVEGNGKNCWDTSAPPPSNSSEFLRQYDHSVESDFRFKLYKSMPLSSINGIPDDSQRSEIGRSICGLESLISVPSFSDLSLKFSNRMPLSCYNCTDAVVENSSRCEENDKDSVETRYCLPSAACSGNYNVRVESNRLESSCAAFRFRESSTENKLHLPVVPSDALSYTPQVAQQSPHTIQMEHSTSIDKHKISVESSRQDGINTAFISRESSMVKLLLPLVTSDAPSSMPQEAQKSENTIQIDHSRDNCNISVDTSRHESTNAASSCRKISMEKKPNRDKQSAAHTMYGSCQFLYMKFPRDFSLPSKKDLVRKFRRFGQIDLVRTKVFECLGSAQVVFLHHIDAVAAYQYAKKKKGLFGGATVLFWLDPHEEKRNQSKFVAPMPKLKSCFRNPHLGGQDDKKRSRKVRFLMQT
ncbi:uncharacterized protein [Euphorbia lathyris]|uniref:uncharacterized protein n=1 Tax=Euphorbia lathyris TaxID=212925 RepID=UPI003313C2B0